MTTEKEANYTPEMEKIMREMYIPTDSQEKRDAVVEELVEKFKTKNIRSIRSKLSNMDLYVAREKVSKVTGKTPAKKDALAAQLREVSGLPMVSAEKLNKTDLQDLINLMENMGLGDIDSADELEDPTENAGFIEAALEDNTTENVEVAETS